MKKPKAPKPVDPKEIIKAQEQANRVNISTPFGSQRYVTGPDGRSTLETSFSPRMNQLAERAMHLAGQDSTRYQLPPGMEKIMGGIMNKVGGRYGMGDDVGSQVAGSGGRKSQLPAPMAKPLAIEEAQAKPLIAPQDVKGLQGLTGMQSRYRNWRDFT